MFPLWGNRGKQNPQFILGDPVTEPQPVEDYLMGAQRRVVTALTRAQERKEYLEKEIARLQADLHDTEVVLSAMSAADTVLANATLDKACTELATVTHVKENSDERTA